MRRSESARIGEVPQALPLRVVRPDAVVAVFNNNIRRAIAAREPGKHDAVGHAEAFGQLKTPKDLSVPTGEDENLRAAIVGDADRWYRDITHEMFG